MTTLPPLDTPVTAGDLGWHYHRWAHRDAGRLEAFLEFLSKTSSNARHLALWHLEHVGTLAPEHPPPWHLGT